MSVKNRQGIDAGFTIIELITAVVTASIFITVVYTAWNYITTTTARRQRYTTLQNECGRVSQLVTGAIQKAEAVLRYDRNSIRLLDTDPPDTSVFSYDGTTISRNGTPLHFILPNIEVAEFRFENIHGYQDGKPYLFDFLCTLVTLQGDTATVQTTVMGRKPREGAQHSGGDFMW